MRVILSTGLLMGVLLLGLPAKGWAWDGPRGLKWGMTWDEVLTQVKQVGENEKGWELKQFKSETGMPTGYQAAEIRRVRMLEQEADGTTAYFDADGKLQWVTLMFKWIETNGSKGTAPVGGGLEAWEFRKKLVEGLTEKYGSPLRDDGSDKYGRQVGHDVQLSANWQESETGDRITVAIIENMSNNPLVGSVDFYFVFLMYESAAGVKAKAAEAAPAPGRARGNDL